MMIARSFRTLLLAALRTVAIALALILGGGVASQASAPAGCNLQGAMRTGEVHMAKRIASKAKTHKSKPQGFSAPPITQSPGRSENPPQAWGEIWSEAARQGASKRLSFLAFWYEFAARSYGHAPADVAEAHQDRLITLARILKATSLAHDRNDIDLLRKLEGSARAYLDKCGDPGEGGDVTTRRTTEATRLREIIEGALLSVDLRSYKDAARSIAESITGSIVITPGDIRARMPEIDARARLAGRYPDEDLITRVQVALEKLFANCAPDTPLQETARDAIRYALIAMGYPKDEARAFFDHERKRPPGLVS